MLKLNVKTKRKPDEVVKQAVEFFGPKGEGLTVTNQNETCAYFEGGGGGVDGQRLPPFAVPSPRHPGTPPSRWPRPQRLGCKDRNPPCFRRSGQPGPPPGSPGCPPASRQRCGWEWPPSIGFLAWWYSGDAGGPAVGRAAAAGRW